MNYFDLQKQLLDQLQSKFGKTEKLLFVGPMSLFPETLDPLDDIQGIIFVDGGLKHTTKILKMFCNVPSLSIGDGDSTSISHSVDILFPSHKDESDLSIALSFLPPSCIELHFLGFMGGRSDHFLCNLGEIHRFLNNSIREKVIRLYDQDQFIIGTNHKIFTFNCHSTFSVLTLEENLLEINGECEYTSEEGIILEPLSSLGLSNKGHGEISIKSNKPLFIAINHE